MCHHNKGRDCWKYYFYDENQVSKYACAMCVYMIHAYLYWLLNECVNLIKANLMDA